MQVAEVSREFPSEDGPRPIRALRIEARRAHAGARTSVARLNTLAARVEGEIDAILRGDLLAVPH
jgi:hypothetical protein